MENSRLVLHSSPSSSFNPSRRIAIALLAAASPVSLGLLTIADGTLTTTDEDEDEDDDDDGNDFSSAAPSGDLSDFSDTIIVLRRNGRRRSKRKLFNRRKRLRRARREKRAVTRPLAPEVRINGRDAIAGFIAESISIIDRFAIFFRCVLFLSWWWSWLGIRAWETPARMQIM